MGYRMVGRFLEACDCYVPCPCWFDDNPDEGECTGVVAWQVENGEVDGVDVTGLSVVSVSQHGGHRGRSGQMRVALLVDDAADDTQFAALSQAFTGALGGPLGDLARMTGTLAAVERASVSLVADNDDARVDAPGRLSVRSKVVRGSTGRPITIGDGLLATLLGTPGIVGRSSRFRLTVEAAGLDLSVTDRSTTSGRFSYAHSE
jgi:hypothetical protein